MDPIRLPSSHLREDLPRCHQQNHLTIILNFTTYLVLLGACGRTRQQSRVYVIHGSLFFLLRIVEPKIASHRESKKDRLVLPMGLVTYRDLGWSYQFVYFVTNELNQTLDRAIMRKKQKISWRWFGTFCIRFIFWKSFQEVLHLYTK